MTTTFKYAPNDRITKEDYDKWVKALKSGSYKQAKGMLYNPFSDGFCCLGVLAKEIGMTIPQIEVGEYGAPSGENPYLRLGLSSDYRSELIPVNDSSNDFAAVIEILESNPPEFAEDL